MDPLQTEISFISVGYATRKNLLRSLARSLRFSFSKQGRQENEIYALTIGGRASDGGNCVGSGSGSGHRAGACIYRGRILPEGFKGKEKGLTEYYQVCLAG
jgi:hypothetical protein